MTWAVIHGDDSWADLERLTESARDEVDQALTEWVTSGPPLAGPRVVAGTMLYEQHLEGGIAVTYFLDDRQQLVGVLRIRRV